MSTPLLYHASGVDGDRFVRTELVDQAVYSHVCKAEPSPSCARCGCAAVPLEGTRQVAVQTVPVGLTPVFLVLQLRMLRCRACHAVVQESRGSRSLESAIRASSPSTCSSWRST